MRNDGQKPVQGGGGSKSGLRGSNSNGAGFIPTSFRALSSYLKIVSSGASTVASTVKSAASAASAIVDRESESGHDLVQWAGFDKLECERGINRLVLLLGYRHGFQVWDVEEENNVHNLVTRQDGPVSFLQVLPKPLAPKQSGDKFADRRPMLIICPDGCFPGDANSQDRLAKPCNGTVQHGHDLPHGGCVPTAVWFYSLRSQSYVDRQLEFGSVVHLVRCSSRVIAVLQTAQIHCFDAATLEKDYVILTNPVAMTCGSGGIGFGPLAVGPRWMAYSGSPIDVPNSGRVSPQQLTASSSFPGPASNGSLVAHYAKESSKQIAAGIVTLGDMGYKKLSRYYSDILPDGNNSQTGSSCLRVQGAVNGQFYDVDNVGMVIVKDTIRKTLVTQFRAHKSPISSLCFDPSGTILVTASVQGHNINVFQIIPGCSGNSSGSDSGASYVHLYRLQRGFTNAVIQDISFSRDSQWIMISSLRGTSHLFSISPFGGSVGFQSGDDCFSSRSSGFGMPMRTPVCCPPNSGLQVFRQESTSPSAPPITLSAVSRIRSGSNGWRHSVSGAAAAATGRMNSLSGAIAAAFHKYKGNDSHPETSFLKSAGHLLVFSSPGSLVQHVLRVSSGQDSMTDLHGVGMVYESGPESDARLVVEAIRKWNVSHKQNHKGREEDIDIYGENGNFDSSKVFPEGVEKKSVYSNAKATIVKDKMALEERYHIYISEAELQMHAPRVPLWSKAEIYFQSMLTDGASMGEEEGASGGEIEVERIPARMMEARSKELVPLIQAPKFQQGRCPVLNGSKDGQLLCQKSAVSEKSKLTWSGSSGSLDSTTVASNPVADLHDATEESGLDGLQIPTGIKKGYVNMNDCPKPNGRLEVVNNRDLSVKETQFNFVNNSIGGLKVENLFEDGGDEHD